MSTGPVLAIGPAVLVMSCVAGAGLAPSGWSGVPSWLDSNWTVGRLLFPSVESGLSALESRSLGVCWEYREEEREAGVELRPLLARFDLLEAILGVLVV